MSKVNEIRVPEIRFKGFDSEWDLISLSTLMNFSNGINASKESYGIGKPMISVLDILSSGRINYSNIQNSVSVDSKTESNYKVESGDLVFVRSSEIVEEVGLTKSYYGNKFVLHSGFTILGKKKSDFHSFFLELSLNTTNRKQIQRKAGGSTRYNVSQKILNELLVQIPSIQEQQKIGDLFAKIDQLIENQQDLIVATEKYKKAMMQKIYSRSIYSSLKYSNNNINFIHTTLGEAVEFINGHAFKSKEYSLTGIRVYRITDVNSDSDKKFVPENKKFANYRLYSEDIIINLTGDGTSYIRLIQEPGYLNQRVAKVKVRCEFAKYYIFYLLSSSKFKHYFRQHSTGAAQLNISTKTLDHFSFEAPPYETQQKIGKFFKTIDDLIEKQNKKLEAYQQMKKALLQKMFV